jgi:hypothetical protein
VLNELAKLRLDAEKFALEAEIARIKATAEERALERKERLEAIEEAKKDRQAAREARRAAALKMQEFRRQGKNGKLAGVPPFAATCEDCRAALEGRKPTHTNDMFRHHSQSHPAVLAQLRQNAASS